MRTLNVGAAALWTIRTVDVERVGDVWIAHLKSGSLDERWIERLGEDLLDLVQEQGARKLVLHFGEIDCLYSMLLGKLVALRRVIRDVGGRVKLYGVSPLVKDVFRVCKLDEFFEFASSREDALADW